MLNLTITVPDGTTDHGTPGLVCVPTRWYTIAVFFVINYIAHTFTIINPPGATLRETITASLCALFVPGSGIIRSLRWIFAFACAESHSLKKANRAGALCMVLKGNNINCGRTYGYRDQWFKNTFKDKNVRLVPINRAVYGTFKLPQPPAPYYFLVEVPQGTPMTLLKRYKTRHSQAARLLRSRTWLGAFQDWWYGPPNAPDDVELNPRGQTEEQDMEEYILDILTLPNNWNVAQLLFSLGQSAYGIYTIYKAMGNQLQLYGFSAFGLTVVPYALLSLVNILATLVTPQYPSMFLIESDDLKAAKRDGGKFAGAIASVDTGPMRKVAPDFLQNSDAKTYLYLFMTCILILAPIGIVGGISQFKFVTASNTLEQRIWISAWLFTGTCSSLWLKLVENVASESTCQYSLQNWKEFIRWLSLWLLCTVLLWVPAIGGMVQVGYMLKEYGSCTRLDFSPF